MSTDEQTINKEDVPAAEAQPTGIRGDVVAAYESMLANVPDAGDQGFDRILEAIARAGSATELDAPWRSSGLEELAGQPITVLSISKIPSDYEGGLPWFLVVEAVMEATGEPITVTTGAVSVVAQLVKAWALGAFPLKVTARVAERASKSGYYPVHLEIRA